MNVDCDASFLILLLHFLSTVYQDLRALQKHPPPERLLASVWTPAGPRPNWAVTRTTGTGGFTGLHLGITFNNLQKRHCLNSDRKH